MQHSFFKTIKNSVKHWYIPLIIGILLILLGFYTISTPVASFLALTILFSWSFIISGLLEIVFAVQNKDEIEGWGWYLAGGILYTLFGALLFANPAMSAMTLTFVIGFYIMFRSIQLMAFSFDLKQYGSKNWGWITVWAVLGLIFSFILLWNPAFAGLSLVIWVALAIISIGFSACFLAFQLKGIKNKTADMSEEWKQKFQHLKDEFYQQRKG
ncbi:HdeD family acid-resistance protein [Sphingobacterium yanglingense]|uniref:Uncharacterized membrane protein HdeD (DUF308 family) n=1 Tax=Sphingobacterium yanglingense TaxID=1437280 RepID=A0A4V6PXB4_9SPHI|nr:DUF308 domain-containing protein [Sphingobacterium yanglingense]TDQ73513.1 uncharacterized membrane protein HdeD (DUF308 family) [Sphingobacterium yanglingense]